MNRKIITYCCFCLFANALQSQGPVWESISKDKMAKVFEQTSSWFKNTSHYSVNVTHASFETWSKTVPFEKSTGYFKKEAENYHSFILGIHTIQNSKYKIVLDTANKTMIVASVGKSIWNAYTLEDYQYTLKSCTSIKMTNFGKDKKYRLEYGEGYPLERYELLVANDGLIKEVTMYYSKKIPRNPDDENSEKVKPRLNITFTGYKKAPSGTDDNEFDENRYFIKKGNKLLPAKRYQNYTLSDQRLTLD